MYIDALSSGFCCDLMTCFICNGGLSLEAWTLREISTVKTNIYGLLNINSLCNYFYCEFNPSNSYINYINELY